MDIKDQFELDHLLFNERICKICGESKNLIEEFYRTRKDKGSVPSSYSYECKECTKKRVIKTRKSINCHKEWQYPDW